MKKDIFDMYEEMDRMFNSFFGHTMLPDVAERAPKVRMPVCDVCETENHVNVALEMPGVDKKDIKLNVTENAIEVGVDKKDEKEVKGKEGYRYSSMSHQYYRKIPIGKGLDAEQTKAEYKNGILRLEIPKKKISHADVKQIEIK